jgi:hypothetical protein
MKSTRVASPASTKLAVAARRTRCHWTLFVGAEAGLPYLLGAEASQQVLGAARSAMIRTPEEVFDRHAHAPAMAT